MPSPGLEAKREEGIALGWSFGFRAEERESPGLMCLILKASDTRKINVSIDKNTK